MDMGIHFLAYKTEPYHRYISEWEGWIRIVAHGTFPVYGDDAATGLVTNAAFGQGLPKRSACTPVRNTSKPSARINTPSDLSRFRIMLAANDA